jgi:hypothetical protein
MSVKGWQIEQSQDLSVVDRRQGASGLQLKDARIRTHPRYFDAGFAACPSYIPRMGHFKDLKASDNSTVG